MKIIHFPIALFLIAGLASCSSGGGKKVFVMSSGKLTVDANDQKNITIEPGTTHNEQEITLTGSGKETLTVKVGAESKTFDVDQPGHYVLNFKSDTLVGGLVNYGSGGKTTNLTGEDVDRMIDSTQQLLQGKNTDDKKSFFVIPGTLKKVSDNAEARIIGPYKGIPGTIDVDASGKTPEMFKFFTNKQKREALDDLIKQRKL